jgi:hypothetical protein
MPIPKRARLAALVVLLCVGGGAGCSSYSQKALRVRDPLVRGDAASAQAFLEDEKPGGDGLPYLMELGLVLRVQGEFARSNETFDQAENLIEDLYTKSISKRILSLATSDESIPYDGEAWERVLVNYYRALNYVDLGLFDDALVECRKINHKLAVYTDASDDPPTYETDAFAQYLTAILYEAAGEMDDAWVSLRLADEAYEHYVEAYGVARPKSLERDLLRVADQLHYTEDLERLRERFPETEYTRTSDLLSRGEIVVLYDEGFIAHKIQQDVTIPILKHEWDDDSGRYAFSLRDRYYHPRPYRKTELEYLLRIALPAYPEQRATHPGSARIVANGVIARTEIVEDLDAIAHRGLDDRMGGILLKTLVRALGKYALSRSVEHNKGEIAGTLVNLLTAVTEKADTRSWITLPRSIQLARLVVEPGVHDVEIECLGPNGVLLESVTYSDVEVGPGEVRFLSHRSF